METRKPGQKGITAIKSTNVCSVGSGKGYDGYRGQQKEAIRRKVVNAVEAKEQCQAINERLSADKVACKVDAKGENLQLRFTAPLRDVTDKPTHVGGSTKQYFLGCGLYADSEGFSKAEFYARQISHQLKLKLFTWEWFDKEIKGVNPSIATPEKQPTVGELIAKFKKHYISEHKKDKHPEANWNRGLGGFLKRFDPDSILTEEAIEKVILSTEANTYNRGLCIAGLKRFLKYSKLLRVFEETFEEFEDSISYEQKELKLLSDEEIEAFVLSLVPLPKTPKKYHHVVEQWRWTFGLVATYGLRPHEALGVLNLFEPYNYQGKLVPALNDPTNTTNLIIVNGKTGMRLAMPLSPKDKDWVKLFNLKQPNPKEVNRKDVLNQGEAFKNFLRGRKAGFKSYSLRHRFNHRCRELGIDTSTAALAMGHSEEMNSTTYKRQMGGEAESKILLNSLKKLETKQETTQTIETLRLENELLRANNNLLNARIAELERQLAALIPIESE